MGSCDVILKCIGIRGSFELDKLMGLKELVGYFCNGDPLVPLMANPLFVQASNFAGFSAGPGFAGNTEQILWFADWPQDFEIIRDFLPRHNKANNKIQGN